VARPNESKRRPRVRKSAPTVRELAEAARTKSEDKEPGKGRQLWSKASAPVKRRNLGQNRFFKIIKKPFSILKRFLRWIVPNYFINSWRELRRVIWPSRKETWRLTLAVFIFSIVFGALVAGVDKGLDEIFKKLVLK